MRWLVLLSLFWNGGILPSAQSGIPLSGIQVRHAFGEWIEFQAQAGQEWQIAGAQLLVAAETIDAGQVLEVSVEPGNRLFAVYDLSRQGWLKPFLTIRYRYIFTLASGERAESQEYTYQYTDNRFSWQSLSPSPGLSINWVEGDLAFGQALADAARLGIQKFSQMTNLSPLEPVALYVYPDLAALESALNLATNLTAAGHAAGEAGLAWMVVSVGPERNLDMESLIPHELAHVLLRQSLGAKYDRIPAWLNEGLASAAELYPNPDYALVLSRARESGALVSFADLCAAIPQDAAGAILAYAQSNSFVRYLFAEYGPAGLQSIVQSYAEGASCDEGPQPATGYTLMQLESRWRRAELNQSPGALALGELVPWLGFAALLLAAPLVGILRQIRRE
jgi:hypothetical protein